MRWQDQLNYQQNPFVSTIPHYLMQFFTYAHLPTHLQEVSQPFCEAAALIDAIPDYAPNASLSVLVEDPALSAVRAAIFACVNLTLPNNPEAVWCKGKLWHVFETIGSKSQALRILLESKDCAVRAKLYVEPVPA